MLNTICNGLKSAGIAIDTAARDTASGIKRAVLWCTNSRTKCVLLGAATVTGVMIGAYARNPAAARALAASIENWAKNTAFPRIEKAVEDKIIPPAVHTYHVLRAAFYRNDKVTAACGAVAGVTGMLVIRAVYRFFRPDNTAAQRDAALDERDVARGERNAALDERDVARGERNAAIDERDVARGERNVAIDERDIARRERNQAREELAQAQAPVINRNVWIAQRDEARNEREALRGLYIQELEERQEAVAARNEAVGARNEALGELQQTRAELEALRRRTGPLLNWASRDEA